MQRENWRKWWTIGAIAVMAASLPCAAGTIATPEAEPQHLELAAHPAFAGVGLVRSTFPGDTQALGSGTLIANRYLVTAAHVVDHASQVMVDFGGTTYTGQRWSIHPQWHGGNYNSGVDLAVVRLTAPVSGVVPAKLFRKPREVGKVATIVGYGASGTGEGGATTPAGTKRAGQNVIDRVAGRHGRLLQTDFDDPQTQPALALEYQPAPGDSGGALFIGTKLAGTVSFLSSTDGTADASFGDLGNYVRLSQHLDQIEQALRDLRKNKRSRRATSLTGQTRDPTFTLLSPTFALATPLSDRRASLPEPASVAALALFLLMQGRPRRGLPIFSGTGSRPPRKARKARQARQGI